MSEEHPGNGRSTEKVGMDFMRKREELFTWRWLEYSPGVWGGMET